MLLDLVYTAGGFILLVWGADRFVTGAASLARILGVPPVIIGLTIVGFATSAPEIFVSVSAATSGFTGMAVGNAIGSNIANIGLVLGVTALIAPVRPGFSILLRKKVWMLIITSLAVVVLFLDNALDRIDGLILLTGMALFLVWVARIGLHMRANDPVIKDATRDLESELSPLSATLWLIIGCAVLLVGANLLVSGAGNIARSFGISDLVIGLSVVAIGTSLPELAVSVISALKRDAGIAVGNIIGSNVFNLLAVVGFAGIAGPGQLDASVLALHYPVMLGFTLVTLLLAYNPAGAPGISRGVGFCLLASFIGYQAMLFAGAI